MNTIYDVRILDRHGKTLDSYKLSYRELSMLSRHLKDSRSLLAYDENGDPVQINSHGVIRTIAKA